MCVDLGRPGVIRQQAVREGDAEVDLILAHRDLYVALRHLEGMQLDSRIVRAEALEQRGNQILGNGGHADLQHAATEVLKLVQGAPPGRQLDERASGVAYIDFTRCGQSYRATRSVKQLNAEGFLELLDLLRQAWLRDAQYFCRASEAAIFRNCQEVAYRPQGHGVSIGSCRIAIHSKFLSDSFE